MSQHTPGPWRVEPGNGGWEVNSDPADGGRWSAVADVRPNSNGSHTVTGDEAEANARLIAAAPALLEACRVVLGTVGESGRCHINAAGLALVRDAIAAAEGRP